MDNKALNYFSLARKGGLAELGVLHGAQVSHFVVNDGNHVGFRFRGGEERVYIPYYI